LQPHEGGSHREHFTSIPPDLIEHNGTASITTEFDTSPKELFIDAEVVNGSLASKPSGHKVLERRSPFPLDAD